MANYIKFFKQSAAPENVAGNIWFDKSTNIIKVGNGATWEEFGGVVDAKFEKSVLTIRKANDVAFTLDFSDVASSEGVNKILSGVADKLTEIDSSISTINQNITNLNASYKAADTSLKNELVDDASADYNTLRKLQGKIEAEASTRSTEDASVLQAAKDYADTKGAAATTKVVEGTDAGDNITIESSTDSSGATTYTINLTNIASASAFAAHNGSADIHVTKAEKERWTAAAADVEDFFTGALSDGAEQVKDTLKEIQDYIASDATAAAEMAANITAAKKAADDAQADVDAVEKALGTGFSDASTVAAQLAAVKTTADAAATKDALKAVTDSYVISFGGAKGAIAIDTADGSNGDVKFAMDGSTLTGHVEGLGSAAFTEASRYATAAQGTKADSAVQSVVEGDTNGTIKVDNVAVKVHGLGSAAYTEASDYDAAGAAAAVLGKAGDASTVMTLYGVKAYADKLAEDTGATVTVTSVDSTSVSDASSYVSIALKLENKAVKVASVSVDTQAVASAGDNAKGLAEASDVKSYVDNQIATNALSWVVLE